MAEGFRQAGRDVNYIFSPCSALPPKWRASIHTRPDYNLDSPSASFLATSSFDLAGALWTDCLLAPGHLRQPQDP